jgi:hypothetical protein
MACVTCSTQIEVTGKVQVEATYTDPTGRCCVGETCSVVVQSSCGGYWAGAGSKCVGDWDTHVDVANQCKGYGACCITGTCWIKNYDDCSGTYLGNGTNCLGDPCADPTGECCRGGVCEVTTEGNCSDGNWSSGGTCSPNPCPDNPGVLAFL